VVWLASAVGLRLRAFVRIARECCAAMRPAPCRANRNRADRPIAAQR